MSLRLVLASAIVTIVFKSIQTELSDGSLLGIHQAVNHDIERRAVGDCGGTFYSDSGQFSSPGYPGYYNNKQECIYVIFIPRNGALILLEFDTFNTEPKHDVVKIYDGLSLTGTLIEEYSGTSIPPAVLSTGNVLAVTFTSDFSATRPGFLANYTAFTNTRENGSLVYISDHGSFSVRDWNTYGNPDTYFLIIVSQGNKVQVDMRFYGCCDHFEIEAFDGASESDALLAAFNLYDYGTLRLTSTGRSLYVHIHQDYDSAPTIYVDYNAIELESSESNWYYEGTETTEWWWWQETTAPPWWWDTTLDPWWYTDHVQYPLGSCGGNYTNDEGSFASPSYPGYYPDQQDCYYYITVSEGDRIVLDIEEFDTEVCCDFVEVFDGDSKSAMTSMGKYFGSNVETEIKSTGRSLFVHFHSDHSKNHRGFYATYRLWLEEKKSNIAIIVGGAVGAAVAVLVVVIIIIIACCCGKKKPAAPPAPRAVQSMTIGGSVPDIHDSDSEREVVVGSIGRGYYNKGYPASPGQPPPYGTSNVPGAIDDVE
ncbi:scavenger receptor cysteine-rich domain-containing protein DMBT1-like isoform X1 [Ptychodera flava]|uniref:scavenger receptor cysteine-rich domain-containing protein DMBT1-like isoform X1 n=1 Tax=Ptychodera flava TaxID=63121 RepID=UPI00396A09AC